MSSPLLRARPRTADCGAKQTDAERRLWMHLSSWMAGSTKISAHRDEARTQWLAGRGFRVLRFSDREALMETEAVLTEIQNHLSTPPNPPPRHGGGSCFQRRKAKNCATLIAEQPGDRALESG